MSNIALSALLFFAGLSAQAASVRVTLSNQIGVALEGAVIYAEPLDAKDTVVGAGCGEKCPEASVAQRKLAFEPGMLVVQAGTKVTFPNQDTMKHQVYSLSPVKKFELPLYGGGDGNPPSVVFDKAGEVVLGCSIHDSMKAHLLVVNTPYFSTGKDGRYVLEGIPPGRYRLKTWHPLAAKKTDLPEKKIVFESENAAAEWDERIKVRIPVKKAEPGAGGAY